MGPFIHASKERQGEGGHKMAPHPCAARHRSTTQPRMHDTFTKILQDMKDMKHKERGAGAGGVL